jgi:hypothetical protein
MRPKLPRLAGLALISAVGLGAPMAGAPVAAAQETSLADWSLTAARGVIDLCRADAPDAAAVAEHGEVWGWPSFVPYLERPEGYKREAGGQSRRAFTLGDTTTTVEVTVQSGEVTSAAPANIHYFRCDVAADQPIGAGLEARLTELYGPPTSKSDQATVWLSGATAGDAAQSDDATLAAVTAAGVGADGWRIELSHAQGSDRVKLTEFRNSPAS